MDNKIKELQSELMWSLYQGDITQAEYDEAINQISAFQSINKSEKEV